MACTRPYGHIGKCKGNWTANNYGNLLVLRPSHSLILKLAEHLQEQ
jgi:hypothetical protein